MEGRISYIITYKTAGAVDTVVQRKLPVMWEILRSCKKRWNGFEILDARRVVASTNGTVRYTEVRLDIDDDGLFIYDKYGTLIDECRHEAEMKEYEVIYSEVWECKVKVKALTETEAIDAVRQLVRDGDINPTADGALVDWDARID